MKSIKELLRTIENPTVLPMCTESKHYNSQNNQQPYTTSVLVADNLKKRHAHVLDTIRSLIEPTEFSCRSMFIESQYVDAKGESRFAIHHHHVNHSIKYYWNII
jgi:ethanolamine utilization cobalamin adenosyltransferase